MTRRERIEMLMDRLLREKEIMDCEHVRQMAPAGCWCRRCKAARGASRRRPTLGDGYNLKVSKPARRARSKTKKRRKHD